MLGCRHVNATLPYDCVCICLKVHFAHQFQMSIIERCVVSAGLPSHTFTRTVKFAAETRVMCSDTHILRTTVHMLFI